MSLSLLLLLSLLSLSLSKPIYSNNLLNVHLIPHTHNDVGWLKTVDQYYMGLNNTIQHAGVQYILDSVVEALVKNKNRKFIYVEIAFFKRWWEQQEESMKSSVRNLVANKQLEFINGGWCMNDEATTLYTDIIDQMTVGHRWLLNEFGADAIPKVAWHIDPFGHSAEQATLFAQMGFEGFFLGRIDYQDKILRMENKEMEYIWRSSSSLGSTAEIFTGVLYNGYSAPPGFDWELISSQEPMQDDHRLNNYNIESRLNDFLFQVTKQAESYVGNHIMLTMGMDFNYENANTWFKNMDKLIKYCNANPEKYGLNVIYSTPSLYVEAKHSENFTWTVKTDDNFPYCDGPHSCWTGFFTSRPSVKNYVRELSSYLQVCKQADVWQQLGNLAPLSGNASILAEAVGVAQHHDAVSGTEKQHVAYDYAQRLHIGQVQCENNMNSLMNSLVGAKSSTSFTFSTCLLSNVSACAAIDSWDGTSTILLNVYNDVAQDRVQLIQFPVPIDTGFEIYDSDYNSIAFQVNDLTAEDIKLQQEAVAGLQSKFMVSFFANTYMVGFNTYFLVSFAAANSKVVPTDLSTVNYTITNNILTLNVNTDGSFSQLADINSKTNIQLSQVWGYYNSSTGTPDDSQASGAYIFRPAEEVSNSLTITGFSYTVGNVYNELIQYFGDFISQKTRIYHNYNMEALDLQYTVGSIPVDDYVGKEVISKFITNIQSSNQVYTDSNGRSFISRTLNYRPTWNLQVFEPISENYYPVNSAIFIRDGSSQFSVLVDRSQSAASINSGEIELMVHRRTVKDDSRGVGEPLNEPGLNGKGLITRGNYRLLVNIPGVSYVPVRSNTLDIGHPPRVMFSDLGSLSFKEYIANYKSQQSLIKSSLPSNVHLQTLETLYGTTTGEVLVRLAHLYEVGEDSVMSQPAVIDIASLFNQGISKIIETTLSSNQELDNFQPLIWTTITEDDKKPMTSTLAGTVVTINPMEVRTYIINF